MKHLQALFISSLLVSPLAVLAENKVEDKKIDLNLRIQSFSIPDDLKVDVWADTSLTQNPSYFYFDSKGRLLVTELYRIGKGVLDIRGFSQAAAIADIQIATLDDRLQLYKNFPTEFPDNQAPGVSDRIVLIEDTNGDGAADTSKVFAEGFNQPLDGLGTGVIERDGKVYYTDIPNLWMLQDQNNDGVADKRVSLQSGFGTRVSFYGHDMHGLVWGPDGRLYWSLGDRGYDITTKEGKTYHAPNNGAVFRAQPDGSNLEVFYTGLRNPQELVFDEFGNLFTADNDGDRGDTERINHLVEGGDSGWHAGHQSIMSFTQKLDLRSYKYTSDTNIPVAWLTNEMSVPRNDKQPAYMLPGIAQLFTGPSGFTYNPSNYLGEKWRNTFFVALFGGTPEGSYVTSYKTLKNGASFLTSKPETFLSGVIVTDIDFGPDGRFYISEFNFGGWSNVNEGAVYALGLKDSPAELTKQHQDYNTLLVADYGKKTASELARLLAIDHQRIRQQAQFELAKRGQQGYEQFSTLAHDTNKDVFSRIHSIWGLSQLVFNQSIDKQQLSALLPLLNDANEQVRIQTARILGDHKAAFAESALMSTLEEDNGQAAMYAAIALGKIGANQAVNTVINKLIQVADKDLWLRHALVMALKGIDKKYWIQHKNHKSPEVRLALLLALRALNDEQVADFLHDGTQAIVDEAILAIDDKKLTKVRPKVAALLNPKLRADTAVQALVHHRIINANFNEGRAEDASRLLAYAGHKGLAQRLVSEALAAIEAWNELNPIDTVSGLPSLANHTRATIDTLVVQYLPDILANTKGQALVQAMRIAQKYNHKLSAAELTKITQDPSADVEIRMQALDLLSVSYPTKAIGVSQGLLKNDVVKLKGAALGVLLQQDYLSGMRVLFDFLASDSIPLQKIALAKMSAQSNAQIDDLLVSKLEALLHKQGENAITLELLSAVQKSTNARLKTLLTEYQNKMQNSDVLTQFAGALAGGDAQVGRTLFFTDGAANCIRCHQINGEGANVGPDLSDIGKTHSAEYLLQALVDPGATIAPGYGTFNLTMHDDKVLSGLFYAETDSTITLGKSGEKLQVFNKSDIKHIQRSASGMPPMNYMLTPAQIRDVVAYLESLKGKGEQVPTAHH